MLPRSAAYMSAADAVLGYDAFDNCVALERTSGASSNCLVPVDLALDAASCSGPPAEVRSKQSEKRCHIMQAHMYTLFRGDQKLTQESGRS